MIRSSITLARLDWHRSSHLLTIALAVVIGTGAVALVAYLLWPTWSLDGSRGPERLPVSVGGTLFNVPTAARHVSAGEVDQEMTQPIDRIFLSIAAHHDSLAPDMRVRTIYPRYLEDASTPGPDGLTMRAFRATSPYGGEDLYFAGTPALTARCTRDASTPGMCLSERRIDGADLTFRFPRDWLSQWRDVGAAMERLTLQLHGGR